MEEKLTQEEKEKKLKELKIELVKQRIIAGRGGKNKIRQIKKEIAKLMVK